MHHNTEYTVYTVIWTYIANHGKIDNILAESPAQAAEMVKRGFSDDFAKRGTIHVVEPHNLYTFKPE